VLSLFGCSPEETQKQFDVNVFGALNVTRAFLARMRERKSGLILWVGSVHGWTTGPGFSLYSASKHAVRAFADSLDEEISPFGLRSINVELGYFHSNILTTSNCPPLSPRIVDYAHFREGFEAAVRAMDGNQPGDTVKAAERMVGIAHGEGVVKGKKIPSTIGFGSDYHSMVKDFIDKTSQRLEEWEAMAKSTDLTGEN